MITLERISERLTDTIKNSGFTQTEIAKRLGVSQQTVSHYVKGNKLPALDTFANLCIILDVTADYLLGLENFDYTPNKAISVSNSFNNAKNIHFKN